LVPGGGTCARIASASARLARLLLYCRHKRAGGIALSGLSAAEHALIRDVAGMHQSTDHRTGLFAIILGTNEIASAIAVQLSRAGYCVVLSYDPHPPVIRRKMAFHDALFGDATQVEDIVAERADDAMQILKALHNPGRVLVSWLGVLDLLPIRSIDVLIDARLQKHRITPDLRRLARLTVGLGPGFAGQFNCDIAVETRPGKIGLVDRGWTDAADGKASQLGDVGAERFVYSPFAGRWHTPIEIGTRVYKDLVLGHLAGTPILAPRDGILRGIARDGSELPAGVKLIEIDPRGRQAQWTGIDERGGAIARATVIAIQRNIMRRVALPSTPADDLRNKLPYVGHPE
jgi:xanthine dehydrogenase accessory factor